MHSGASFGASIYTIVTLPWASDEFESTREIMGDNYWKYGIEANRKELFDPTTLELEDKLD